MYLKVDNKHTVINIINYLFFHLREKMAVKIIFSHAVGISTVS